MIRTLKEGLQVLSRYDNKDDKRRQKVEHTGFADRSTPLWVCNEQGPVFCLGSNWLSAYVSPSIHPFVCLSMSVSLFLCGHGKNQFEFALPNQTDYFGFIHSAVSQITGECDNLPSLFGLL